MIGHELTIEQHEVAGLEARDQPGQSNLRGIPLAAEHAFAEEGAAQLHPVKAADQLMATPHLD
jgi:hypothetical protein